MSSATVNFHDIKSASARVMQSQGIGWLALEFRDERDELRDVTLFSADPQALLDSIAGRTVEVEAV